MPPLVTLAVEGAVDEAVLGRVVSAAGAGVAYSYGKNGKPDLRRKVNGYNNAARFAPWIVLVDLDLEASCAPELVRSWLPEPASQMCFRVAVRSIEAWLLGDPERLARFLAVSEDLVPSLPEHLDDPKKAMVDLASRSRRRDIRQDMLPRPGSGIRTGPAYPGRLIEFALQHWRVPEARKRIDSLDRSIRAIGRLVRPSRSEARRRRR